MVERGSDKHGSRLDDAMAGEVEGTVRGGHGTRGEEWREAEPSGEDQPDVDLAPEETLAGGTPEGMTRDDVEGRSRLAQYLSGAAFPATAAALRDHAAANHAPDDVRDVLDRLPYDRDYGNVNDVWTAAGGGEEQERF
jgi:hypothetical protein